jgi:inosine-uridine nucleoside N-ribohydrolase
VENMNKVHVIMDTDIGPDCDDAGALAVLHRLADDEKALILGITHCTSSPYGAGCIDAINRFYKRPDIPIGTLKKEGFLVGPEYERYNRYITENYYNVYREKQAPDALRINRKILSEQPDKSVTFIGIGPLINLADLVDSVADEFSPLNGLELVKAKVKLLVSMAGYFEQNKVDIPQAEWNVQMDIKSAQKVFGCWPTPIVFCGYEVGEPVLTGIKLLEVCGEENPVKKAYSLYTGGKARNSWDLITIFYAVCDECGLWELSDEGTVKIDDSGVSHFSKTENRHHRYLKNKAPICTIEEYIEGLLIR